MVLWSQYHSRKSTVQCRRYARASDTWTEGPNLDKPNSVSSALALAIDPAGNAVIAWNDHFDYEHNVLNSTRFSPTANKWDEWSQVSFTSGSMGDPALAIDQSGQAMLMWPQYSTTMFYSDMYISYARLTGH